jgi:polysaccharide biosynthesis transport protein
MHTIIDSTNGHLTPHSKPEARHTNPFRAYVDLIYRRKWTIIIVFLLVLASTLVYNLTQPDVFMAKAVLMTESQNVSMGTGAAMAIGQNTRPLGFYQAVLGSRPFREQAAKDFMAGTNELPQPVSPMEVPQLFSQNLSLTKAQYLDFIELGAKAYDPDVAYLLCTVATQNLKNRCQEIEQEETQNEVSFIEKQTLLAREKLEEADQALQKFKDKANISVAVKDGDIVSQLAELENKLAEVQAQREMSEINLQSYEARLKQMNGNRPAARVDLDVNQSPEVLRLKSEITRYEQQYRDLTEQNAASKASKQNLDMTAEGQDLLEKLNAKKRQLVQAVVQSSASPQAQVEPGQAELSQSLEEKRVMEQLNIFLLRNRELYYSRLVENFRKKNPNIVDRAMDFTRLSRAKTVYENLYSFLIERGEEAKIKAASGTGGVRIIDPPTRPQNPIPKNLQSIILTATLCGLALGLVVALAKDKFDSSFRGEDEVTEVLGLPVLGMIPAIDNKGAHAKANTPRDGAPLLRPNATADKASPSEAFSERLIIHLNPKDPIVEAYRALRTNIAFLSPDRAIKKLLVTSTVPGEGKTLTSANLAISFAEIGKQVVLVDTDLRRPRQHNYFNINKAPGLTNYLYDGMPLHEAMHEFKTPNFTLRVLPSGKLPPNPVQTLTSARMRELIELLSEEYDMVIFDTPPLISVTDPLLLSVQMDGVLMIVKANATPREAAVQAHGKLKTAHAHILGAVLNNVEVAKGYGYYRYYYNYYHYDGTEKEGRKSKKQKAKSKV